MAVGCGQSHARNVCECFCSRHGYATELHKQELDFRAVQKQLGYASVQATQQYADALTEDIREQIKGLWN
jgi:site-specific recombinase XerD